jgi:small subunit ribosomal protein S21
MLIIKVKNNNIDQAIKQLRRKVKNTKQLNLLRDKQQHTKPSISKRLQKQKAVYIQKIKDKEQ